MAEVPALTFDGVTNKGLIGKGAFGSVFLVENKAKEQFAVKVMDLAGMLNTVEREVAENELKVLKELSHDHVLVYLESFLQNGRMYIITEYCQGGDLSGFLDETNTPVPEDLLLVWLYQLACGLEYMHNNEPNPVLHRDLKPSNIYLTEKGDIRLGDMGIARILDSPDSMAFTFCGTPPYMSPEALYEKPYNSKTDIWSLGCCVVEMVTLERAYNGVTILILRDAVLKMRQPLPRHLVSQELDELVSKMLRPNYEDRASATEILDSGLLQDCAARGQPPQAILKRHNLLGKLNQNPRPSPKPSGRPDTAWASNLQTECRTARLNLDEGETISNYRLRDRNRMHGRRQDSGSTITSESLLTVLYQPPATVKAKTKKKDFVVSKPIAQPPAQAQDDSLSRSVLTSFVKSLSSMDKTREGGQPPQAANAAAPAGFSRPIQVHKILGTLTRLIGKDAMHKASSIVSTASSRAEVLSGLEPLMRSEDQIQLRSIVIYMLLMNSIKPDN